MFNREHIHDIESSVNKELLELFFFQGNSAVSLYDLCPTLRNNAAVSPLRLKRLFFFDSLSLANETPALLGTNHAPETTKTES